jgi:hypothetical protein
MMREVKRRRGVTRMGNWRSWVLKDIGINKKDKREQVRDETKR